MTKTKNRCSVSKAVKTNEKGRKTILYLSSRDEEKGLDIQLDMQGYIIIAL